MVIFIEGGTEIYNIYIHYFSSVWVVGFLRQHCLAKYCWQKLLSLHSYYCKCSKQ